MCFNYEKVALKVFLHWCKGSHEYHLLQEHGICNLTSSLLWDLGTAETFGHPELQRLFARRKRLHRLQNCEGSDRVWFREWWEWTELTASDCTYYKKKKTNLNLHHQLKQTGLNGTRWTGAVQYKSLSVIQMSKQHVIKEIEKKSVKIC